jgi:hypothetical protein
MTTKPRCSLYNAEVMSVINNGLYFLNDFCYLYSEHQMTATAQSVKRMATAWMVRASYPGVSEIFHAPPDWNWSDT